MKKNHFIKKIICLIIILNILAINLTSFMQVFAQKEDNIDNVTRIADKSTVDDYKEIISNSTHGTANNGRVWTDKSVYSKDDSNEVTLDNKFNIQFDDDFLNVFSALGTSQQILAKEIAPLDVVLLLDVSTSMTTSGTEYKDSAEKVIEEANKLINELMGKSETNTKVSKGNRIGVVVYSGGTQVLLPLNHYDTLEGDNYLSLEEPIEKNEKFWATVSTHVKVEGKTFENKTSKPMYADSTYLQGALYQGMRMLATESNTIYTNPKTGAQLNRTPVLIVLTDGATNTVGATETGDSEISIDWWDPLSWVTEGDANNEAILPTRIKDETDDYRNFIPYPNGNPLYVSCDGGTSLPLYKAIAPRTLATLLTAGYMKNWIEDNYSKNAINDEKINLYGFGIGYNIGTGINNTIQLNSTINPKEYFTSENDDEQIQKAYTALENYIKDDGQIETMEFGDYRWLSRDITGKWDFNHPSGENKKYDVKSIEDVYYIDKYFTADDANIQEKFQELFSTILTTTLINTFTPIKGENCLGTEDTLTYVDSVGDYMEVKDVSDLLLFGQRYDIVEFEGTSEERTIENPEKTYKYYKAVGENGEDLPISNPSYNSEEEYKLSDIKIWKEKNKTGDSKEELHIEIPNKLIPIKVDKISLDIEKTVEKFETNNGTDLALPIRILYTVGVNNEILNNKKIDFSKISPEYVTKNMNEEGISFFSNKFEGTIYDENSESTLGDAVVSFSPSSDNSFYVYQENATIYKNSSAGEGLLEECGGTVTLTDEVKDMSEINKDETYYYIIEVYVPQDEVDAPKGKLLKYATSQKGEVFYENDNITCLTYYDTKLEDEVEAKGENTVVATKIGKNRIIDLKKLSLNKEQNITGTASTYYAPSYVRIENEQAINNYLGNNGRIIIDQELLGSIKVTKLGDNDEPLNGVTFGLYAKEDIVINEEVIYSKGEEIERKTTGEDGIIEFTDLRVGSYEIKELQAPEGYELLKNTVDIEISKSKYIHELSIKNNKILGSVKITKLGEDDKPLSGAIIGLYAKENILDDQEVMYEKGEEIGRKTTGEDGVVEFNNLLVGSYEIKEVQAPEGYELLNDTVSFEVNETKYNYEFTIKNNKIVNQEILGSAKITKVGDNDKPLSGATFAIYAREDIISNEEIIYKKGEEIERKTTGEDGIVEFNNLPIGSYEIKEVQAPEGYTLLEETAKFDVTESKYIFEFTVKNHKIIELDPTLVPGTIPQTGEKVNLVFVAITVDVIALGIFSYTKYRKLKF